MSEVLETQHLGYSVSPVSPLFHNPENVLVTDNNKDFSVSVSHYRHSPPSLDMLCWMGMMLMR